MPRNDENMKILIATKNPGKFEEIVSGLASLSALGVEFVRPSDLGIDDEVEEHGSTHGENAILKARHFFAKTGLATVGEDSGIHVDAFPGELGVMTRRWGGLEKATDEEWIKYFLTQMERVPAGARGAKFVCFAAVILSPKDVEKPHIFAGETRGVITKGLEAPLKAGIPISSCFRPEGFDKVYAALTNEEKNRVSHRGKAMAKLAEFLRVQL